jgi:hypothetical protein
MNSRAVVVVGRKWHHPEITIAVSKPDLTGGIEIQMKMDDFVTAVCQEIAHPAMVLTKRQLASNLRAAVEIVVSGMKEETNRVM